LAEESGRRISTIRTRVNVAGLVQGVGFRPFVWREATSRGLRGFVGNDADGVVLEVEGLADDVSALVTALSSPPPLARVDGVSCTSVPLVGDGAFTIRESDVAGARRALVSPDTALCADCLHELRDPTDRRYLHPFVNCTSCGPRYTIIESVPYDRSRTTMSPFPMCAECGGEYTDPANRRFHAEPVACPSCGPSLTLLGHSGDPIAGAVALLRTGSVLAVKGLGGYHLAVDACSENAVSILRSRKHREDRPFALMVASADEACELCLISTQEFTLLTSPARPIVIMTRRAGTPIAPSVAPGAPTLGVMLAYTPLHVLLLEAFGGPLVMTSGNVSDEPIAFADDDAARRLASIADGFLAHDRAIRTRVDDSVMKVVRDRVLPIRRSRGYVPSPIALPFESSEVVLGMGAGLKNTFCIARGRHAFVSHHIGDLENYETFQSYVDGIAHLLALLDVTPTVIAHDLHPDYPSTVYAAELAERYGARLVGVQHHHAHIASCLVDNGVVGPVIGVAFDGLGLGCDQHAWGGEFLVADVNSFDRAAHFAEVPMPGADAAVRAPWRMALSHLDAAYEGAIPPSLGVVQRNAAHWDAVLSLSRSGLNAPPTSSAGRLFDAVSALLGIRDEVTYEGQAAIELEYAADPTDLGSYAVAFIDGQLQVSALVRALADELLRSVPVPVLAARFHNSLADAVLAVCQHLRAEHQLSTVALSGGVFQNALLVSRCLDRLEPAGFTVLTHRQVPPNDGGISLGQSARQLINRPAAVMLST
jgi:hydrogenase maturation protein HypF